MEKKIGLILALMITGFFPVMTILTLDTRPLVEIGYNISTLTGRDIKNPEIALEHGIRGYIEIDSAPGTPDRVVLPEGREVNVTILLHFVSYLSNFTETQVTLDPDSEYGLIIEKCLGEGRGSVILNDYITYHSSGEITLEAGEVLPVTMMIRVPEGQPSVTIPLRAVGIEAEVPILHNMDENLET